MKINTLIFDLGGVLYQLDEKKFVKCFEKYNFGDFKSFYNPKILELHFKYETGKINTLEFYNHLKKIFTSEISFQDFCQCWNSLLVGFINENLDLLESLLDRYNIFILSNINEEHYNQIIGQQGFRRLKAKKIYFSHQYGMRKPDPEFFKLVLNENHLIPSKTLFIDDNPTNIQTAKNLGLKTLLIENPFLLISKLKKILS